jgi:tetratricopeptide (TPR) repeat protein
VLQLLGDIQTQRGDLPAALSLFQQAGRSTGEVLKRRPHDQQAIFDHAQSVSYIGEVAYRGGDYATALAQFQAYQALARRLASTDPRNLDWQAEVEDADTNLGAVLLGQARAEEAARVFQEALAISRRLAAAPTAKRIWRWDEAQSFAWLADDEVARGRLDAALADRRSEGAVYEALIAASPHDSDAAVALANSRAEMASIELAGGGAAAATLALRDAAAQLDRLVREAPDNNIYQAEAVRVLRLLAQAQLQDGQLRAAGATATRAVDGCEAQVRSAELRHEAALTWRGLRLGGARIVALKVAAASARTPAAQRAALRGAPDEAARLRELLAGHPGDRVLAATAAEAALLAGDFEDLDGDPARAKSDWAWSQAVLTQGPQAVAATDRTAVVLREAAYRLSLLHPPTGPLSAGGPARVRPTSKGQRTPIDYRW